MKKTSKAKTPIAEYHLVGNLGVLGGTMYSGTTKEVTLGRWGDSQEIKLDIRKWNGHTVGRGISLAEEEVRDLRCILDTIDFGKMEHEDYFEKFKERNHKGRKNI